MTHVQKMLLRTLQLLPPVSVHDLILCPGDIDVQPFQWNGFDTVVAYTYIIPRAETNGWRTEASEMQRRNLRKGHAEAERDACAVEVDPSTTNREPSSALRILDSWLIPPAFKPCV